MLRCGSARPSDGGFNPALAWSNDGRWLVTTSWDGSLCAFRGDDGAPAAPALQQVPASRVFDWHLAQAELAGERRRPSVARFHLAREEAADKDAANAWRTWPALALAHHSLGEDSEARRFLARAEEKRRDLQRRLADESPELSLEAEWPDFELLYAEAAAALTPR